MSDEHQTLDGRSLADELIQQAQRLIEAATGTPGPIGKRELYEAAEAALKAAELARRGQLDRLNAEIGDQVFLLPRDHYKWATAIAERELRSHHRIADELREIRLLLEGKEPTDG